MSEEKERELIGVLESCREDLWIEDDLLNFLMYNASDNSTNTFNIGVEQGKAELADFILKTIFKK